MGTAPGSSIHTVLSTAVFKAQHAAQHAAQYDVQLYAHDSICTAMLLGRDLAAYVAHVLCQ